MLTIPQFIFVIFRPFDINCLRFEEVRCQTSTKRSSWIQLKLIIITSFHFAQPIKKTDRDDLERFVRYSMTKIQTFSMKQKINVSITFIWEKNNHSIGSSSFSTKKFFEQQNSSSCLVHRIQCTIHQHYETIWIVNIAWIINHLSLQNMWVGHWERAREIEKRILRVHFGSRHDFNHTIDAIEILDEIFVSKWNTVHDSMFNYIHTMDTQ